MWSLESHGQPQVTTPARILAYAAAAAVKPSSYPAAVDVRRSSRDHTYLIRVAVAGPAEYEAFYMNKLAELPGLARVNSQFTMKAVKRDRGVPIVGL